MGQGEEEADEGYERCRQSAESWRMSLW
jgi:hypothetical protein